MATNKEILSREVVHKEIGDYLGENPFGTSKFLAISDYIALKLRETDRESTLNLMKQAAISETIRVRIDTVRGYQEAFFHFARNLWIPLVYAEGNRKVYKDDPDYNSLVNVAAINLSVMILHDIRASS